MTISQAGKKRIQTNILDFFVHNKPSEFYPNSTHANNLKNVILPSAENIEEMAMKDKEDAEMDLNRLGVAVAE